MGRRLRQRRLSGAGFTLIELVAVVAVMAIIFAVAAPALGRMGERADIDSAARMISNAITLLREEAITSGNPCWLVYQVAENRLQPQVSAPGSQKRENLSLVVLPEDVWIRELRIGSADAAGGWNEKKNKGAEVVCYPDGMVDEHTVTLEGEGYLARLAVFSLTGQVEVTVEGKE